MRCGRALPRAGGAGGGGRGETTHHQRAAAAQEEEEEAVYLRSRGRFLSRGEDHSVHRRHLIANLSHLALPHKLNDRLNGWPSRYAKERFFGYFAKYPVKDFDGPLRSLFHALLVGDDDVLPARLGEKDDALRPL